MLLRLCLTLLVSCALFLPQDAMAASKKKKTKKTTTSSQTVKKSSSSSDKYRKIGDGPMGSFVAAPDNQVFLNVAGFIYGMPTIGYERALGNDNSWTGQVGFRNWGGTGFSLNYLGVLGSYRWYLGNHAKMQGFYAGPLGTVQMVNANYDATIFNGTAFVTKKESTSSFIFGVGGEGGYQWILPFGLTFSGGLTAGYYFGSITLASGAPSFSVGGAGAGLNGTVGYAF